MALLNASPLARYSLVAYTVLVGYASLYPLSSWRDHGVGAFAFLGAAWPRYVTVFDVTANLLAYLPFGFLVALVVRVRLSTIATILIGALASVALSVSMEALQSYLPSRHPSNLDVLTNGAGGLIGAIVGSVVMPRLLGAGGMLGARDRWFRAGNAIDLGLVLVALWWVTQLNPETLLFGNGSLRDAFDAVSGQRYDAAFFVRVEAGIVAAQLVAIGLFSSALATSAARGWVVAIGVICVALLVRAIAFAVLFTPAHILGWATRGAMLGLVLGSAVYAAASFLPRVPRMALAGLLLMGATALVNIAPANPYSAHTLQVWRQGHFLNFNGLTGFVSSAWPFVALAYLLFAGHRRAGADHD